MTVGVIGYISRDIVIKKYYNSIAQRIGGKAYYSGITLSNIGIPTIILIHVDKNSQDLLDKLKKQNIELYNFVSKKTPAYKNIYLNKNLDSRIWKANLDNFQYSPDMINSSLLPKLSKCKYIHLCPTTLQEMNLDFIKFLKENTSTKLTADLDDILVKKISEKDGTLIKPQSKKVIEKILPHFEIIVIAEEDKHFICDGSDEDLLRYIASKNVNEVILLKSSRGALIYSKKKNKLYKIPAIKPRKLVDTTGIGDTFTAAYIGARSSGEKIQDAGNFAAKVASIKLESYGAISRKIKISEFK